MNDELSKNARALLDAARPQGGPTRAQKAKLTVAVMTATASTAAAMTTGAAATGTSVLKLLGAGLIAAIVGVSSTVLVKKASEPPRAPAPAVARSVPNTVAAPLPVAPEPPSVEPQPIVVEATPAVAEPERTVQPAPIAAPPLPQAERSPAEPATPEVPPAAPARHATSPDTTAAEVTALGAALEALEEGRPLEALQTARTARRAAPHGALRPELTVIEIEALCALQRQPEASELAASMPESDRTSLVVQRLRRTCAAR